MKKQDIYFGLFIIILFSPFFIFSEVFEFYKTFNDEHGIIMSFIKFAILATLGEVIGLRIKAGVYNQAGFGILPRAVVWGFLGISIKAAFVIFAEGVPPLIEYAGLEGAMESMQQPPTFTRYIVSLSISTLLNLFFAPVFMTFHKITDIHIIQNGGKLSALLKPIPFVKILNSINWKVQWNFVFMKTIPFFWIPAHSITFMLPSNVRILIAAVLGVVLGVILAVATQSDNANAKKEA